MKTEARNLLNRIEADKDVVENGWWEEERNALAKCIIEDKEGNHYKSMPIKYSVYHKDSNPIFGEETTHVEIDDEAGGGVIVLTQFPDDKKQQLRLDIEELEEILVVANKMMAIYNNNEKQYEIEMQFSDTGESLFRYVSLLDDVKGAWRPTEKGAEEDAQTYFQRKYK